jgi:hypothetical protein
MQSRYVIELPNNWARVDHINRLLKSQGDPFLDGVRQVHILIPEQAKLMLDGAVVLLSLANQLADSGRVVLIEFIGGFGGVMGYLDRMAFFDKLHPAIRTKPKRPSLSRALRYGGTSAAIFEFHSINPNDPGNLVPQNLVSLLETACSARPDCNELSNVAFTLFAELVENIYAHSETVLDGFAAFQVYSSNKACVVVSDSGKGILEIIRPALSHEMRDLSDTEILVTMFSKGLSSQGQGHGCGLPRCVKAALKFKFEMNIRLPTCNVKLRPALTTGGVNVALCTDDLPRIAGTHISFDFRLDKSV